MIISPMYAFTPTSIFLFIMAVLAGEHEIIMLEYPLLFGAVAFFITGFYMHQFGYRFGGSEEEWATVNNESFYKQPIGAKQ